MARLLLRSGFLNDFQAVGNNGQAVFESALQIREALKLRGMELAASILAIPQTDDASQRVDWYAPAGKRVVSWIGADGDTRRRALKHLERCLDEITMLSERSQRAEKPAIRRFGLLLARAFMFPGANHVFLVDGRPIITFWGFIAHHQKVPEDALIGLRSVAEPEPVVFAAPEPPPAPVVEEPVPLVEPINTQAALATTLYEVTSSVPDAPEEEQPMVITKKKRSPKTLAACAVLLALPVMAAAGWYIYSGQTAQEEMAVVDTAVVSEPQPAEPESVKLVMPTLAMALPLQAATVPDVPPPPGALVLPADALKAGSTRFLNGNWQLNGEANAAMAQPDKLPALRSVTLQIKDNEGTATLNLGGKLSCKADIYSGLMPSGALMVKSRARARCSDGSRYPMPEIACRQGETGAARCDARYGEEEAMPITFKKVGK
ncbi:ssrAB-activated protein [Enterobacteriaceae bacterium 4M9]|nr:ssrAB-activated protein [Enterobacteriaceae bacterium 4M9]